MLVFYDMSTLRFITTPIIRWQQLLSEPVCSCSKTTVDTSRSTCTKAYSFLIDSYNNSNGKTCRHEAFIAQTASLIRPLGLLEWYP